LNRLKADSTLGIRFGPFVSTRDILAADRFFRFVQGLLRGQWIYLNKLTPQIEIDLGMHIAFKAVIQLPYWLMLTP